MDPSAAGKLRERHVGKREGLPDDQQGGDRKLHRTDKKARIEEGRNRGF